MCDVCIVAVAATEEYRSRKVDAIYHDAGSHERLKQIAEFVIICTISNCEY